MSARLTDAKGQNFNKIAEVIEFDHNAILVKEPPASSPDEGTGLNMSKTEFLTFNMDADEIETPQEIEKLSFDTIKKWVFDAVKAIPEKTEEDTNMSDENKNAQDGASADVGVTKEELKDLMNSLKDEVVKEVTAQFKSDEDDAAERQKAAESAAARSEAIKSLVNSGAYDEGEITDDIPTEFLVNQAAKKQKGEVSHISASAKGEDERDDTKMLDFSANYKEDDNA